MDIKARNVPPDIAKKVKDIRKEKLDECETCQYAMGRALIEYVRRLEKIAEVKEKSKKN